MWFIKDIQPNLDHNMREHLAGAVHMQKAGKGQHVHQSLITNFFSGPKSFKPNDFTDPMSAEKCLWYWQLKVDERELMMQLCPAQWPLESFYFDVGLLAEFPPYFQYFNSRTRA